MFPWFKFEAPLPPNAPADFIEGTVRRLYGEANVHLTPEGLVVARTGRYAWAFERAGTTLSPTVRIFGWLPKWAMILVWGVVIVSVPFSLGSMLFVVAFMAAISWLGLNKAFGPRFVQAMTREG
jgi:hypothetical protein